jgi:hypothetical protein
MPTQSRVAQQPNLLATPMITFVKCRRSQREREKILESHKAQFSLPLFASLSRPAREHNEKAVATFSSQQSQFNNGGGILKKSRKQY